MEKKTAKASEELSAAQAQAAAAREQLEAAEKENKELAKKLAMTSEDVAEFKVMFKTIQQDFGRMASKLHEIEQRDTDTAAKLRKAVLAVVEQMKDMV